LRASFAALATRTREVSPARPAPHARAYAVSAAEAGRRTFWLGVAGCTTAVSAFLFARLTAWPPHEDETLALFVGRQSLGGLFHTVQTERGGAPLHFLCAWVVVHLGGGLVGLRLFSAVFAIASIPIVALLAARIAGRIPALVATVIVCASWMLLFHGIYGRMYSLFLLTSALSYLAFLSAVANGDRRRWALWVAAVLATVATHPYGALVLASQVVYVLARARTREAFAGIGAVIVLGLPFWYSDLVLAGRFDVGVGSGGKKLDDPYAVLEYLFRVAGDFTTGFTVLLIAVLLVAGVGGRALWLRNRDAALLTVCVVAVPTAAFLLARFGESTSPESRHLIFALPFFAVLVALGLIELTRMRAPVLVVAVVLLLTAEVAWGWDKTAPLYEGEPTARVEAREAASQWLAASARADDVLFGYEPLYLGGWERNRKRFSATVVPRADAKLALDSLREAHALGRGVWVFDASDTNNFVQHMEIPLRVPNPATDFEARVFGPFLVIRSRRPTRTVRRFLVEARQAELVGKSLYMGDADVNLVTVDQALAALGR
jgi:Dolichyl-phosphate-mannose-protein mannosyltransferase